jgi:hypothetical protein
LYCTVLSTILWINYCAYQRDEESGVRFIEKY